VKGSKEKLTVWVNPEVSKAVRSMAAAQGVTVSQMSARLLELGSRDQVELAGLGVLVPALENAVERASARVGDRLARLMATAALESTASRREQYQILIEMFGAERAKRINEAAYKTSLDRLRTTSQGVRELLGLAASTDPAEGATGDLASDHAAVG
jgi:hypothetical protein